MEEFTSRIGEAAGATFNELVKGDTSLTKIKTGLAELGFDANISAMAIGWLARENKVVIVKNGKVWNIRLR
ncbi:MAG: winged helix-turn-helix domain-containing protein [Methanosarcinales archaeon]|nr:winged helix-turn-helix domain-containing protein [ANME-2 cluster archaeon]MDF1530816.1 winged helix-turn-helix domain-containing protein [ANME-2 cluster archaeon]MDW7776473.1 winged helix-turn-helix domain-containing protein [Methanosarcinales archaeon]